MKNLYPPTENHPSITINSDSGISRKRGYPTWVNEYSLLALSILSFGGLIFLLGVPLIIALIFVGLLWIMLLWMYLYSVKNSKQYQE